MQILTKYKGASLGNATTGDALLSPNNAFVVHQEFVNESPVTAHTFTLTGSPAVSKSATVVGGALVIASNATPAAFGVVTTAPVAQAAAGRNIYCEMSIAVTDVTTASCAQFAGLSSSATVAPITVAGVPDATRSCIGFAFVAGAINGVFGSAATGTVALATGNTAGTLRRLGFVVKGTTSIDWYVDGAYVTTSTTVPTTVMFESFSNASAVQQGCTVDYFHLTWNR
jgi:hypothetical protein